jgi:SAM-dependent methyltransferase
MNNGWTETDGLGSVEKHLEEMLRNRASWERKPVLQRVYGSFYKEIASHLVDPVAGSVVEIGSGIGMSKRFIPNCITTDIFPNPWLDRVEDAYELKFVDSSIGNLILFDVFHHLRYPGAAFAEFWRVVAPRGRVILFEPAMGLLGKLVYGLFHHEPIALNSKIELFPLCGERPSGHGYYAAQGNAWRIFIKGERAELLVQWNIIRCRTLCALSYALSGGFSKPCLYPPFILPAIRMADRLLEVSPQIFGTRLLVVLEKGPDKLTDSRP